MASTHVHKNVTAITFMIFVAIICVMVIHHAMQPPALTPTVSTPKVKYIEKPNYTDTARFASGGLDVSSFDRFFTIIVMPDTQKYTMSPDGADIFRNQTAWIVSQKERRNIAFVIHVGDLVEHPKNETEWQIANESMATIEEADIPFSVVPGNHDHPTDLYDEYFPATRFSDEAWWGGNYGNEAFVDGNHNNYQLLSILDEDYIFVSIDWCPTTDEIIWANEIFEAHADRKGILTTHGYLDGDAKRTVHKCKDTSHVWDSLLFLQENVQLVFSGHVHNESYRVDENSGGNNVHQMLADYQKRTNGGDGFLRILTFVPSEEKIYVETYSTTLDLFEIDENSQFEIEYIS